MAKRRTPAPEPQPATLSAQEIKAAIPKLERRLRELKEVDFGNPEPGFTSRLDGLHRKLDSTLVGIFGADTLDYNRHQVVDFWYSVPMVMGREYSEREKVKYYGEALSEAIPKVETALEILREQLEDMGEAKTTRAAPVSFTKFRDDLLMALARHGQAHGPRYYDLKEVADSAGLRYEIGWVRKAAYGFRDYGYVKEAFSMGDEDENFDAELTGEGLERVEELIAVEGAALADETMTEAPASDRVVTLDHNSAEYKEAVQAIHIVIKEVRSNNEYSVAEPEDREQRLMELEAGDTLLKSARVRVAAFTAFLLPTLYYLADKFVGAAISDAASTAVAAIKTLLGI